MSWLDVLIIVIFTINMIKGWKNGLILSFFYMGSFIIAGIVAKIYYPLVSKYIMVHSTIFIKVQAYIGKRFQTATNDHVVAEGIVENNIFEVLKFPKSIENLLMKSDTMHVYSERAMEGVHSYLSDVLARMFIDFISILILFFAVKILLFIIGHLLDGIASLPVLKQFNRLGGVVFGLVKGLLIVFIFLAIITPFITMMDASIFVEGLEKSIIANVLYDHNPIIGLIQIAIKG
ncbi:CvpA family protein [Marinisporobacter balticus]|uniref:Colicin V production protein n=1 Tax=Marinisporobacter balticus TaxID=2018667 RepID=A0A4R2L5T4_9FIRM|nr:CvpA family protein [Marinisporobacter balticus]TCO77998.1 colicin V production protein [Marinisporobacter balticus]